MTYKPEDDPNASTTEDDEDDQDPADFDDPSLYEEDGKVFTAEDLAKLGHGA